jgi:hypothetical protein
VTSIDVDRTGPRLLRILSAPRRFAPFAPASRYAWYAARAPA